MFANNSSWQLEPCPCCGSDRLILDQRIETDESDGNTCTRRYVRCFDCELSGPPELLLVDAIKAWNKRTPLPLDLLISIRDGQIRTIPKPHKRKRLELPQLQPCPKCKGSAALDSLYGNAWVFCQNCHTLSTKHETPLEATTAWNQGELHRKASDRKKVAVFHDDASFRPD